MPSQKSAPARSRAYPLIDLETACEILQEDLAGLGNEFLSRGDLAGRLGYRGAGGGVAARKVAALGHYGLLVRTLNGYGLSDWGRRLQSATTDPSEHNRLLRSVLERPVLFRRVLERYRPLGRVPVPRDLALVLTESEFGITAHASAEAGEVFWRSATFAGVLTPEGEFVDLPSQERAVISSRGDGRLEPNEESSRREALLRYIVPLTNGKRAYFETPSALNEDDVKVLVQFMDGVMAALCTSVGLGKVRQIDAGPRRLKNDGMSSD